MIAVSHAYEMKSEPGGLWVVCRVHLVGRINSDIFWYSFRWFDHYTKPISGHATPKTEISISYMNTSVCMKNIRNPTTQPNSVQFHWLRLTNDFCSAKPQNHTNRFGRYKFACGRNHCTNNQTALFSDRYRRWSDAASPWLWRTSVSAQL